MEGFACTVERTDEFVVKFDDTVINEEWMENFREFMYDFYSLKEHVDHIAQRCARFGTRFVEGYGVPLESGEITSFIKELNVNHAINIKVASYDSDVDVFVRKL